MRPVDNQCVGATKTVPARRPTSPSPTLVRFKGGVLRRLRSAAAGSPPDEGAAVDYAPANRSATVASRRPSANPDTGPSAQPIKIARTGFHRTVDCPRAIPVPSIAPTSA